MRCSSAFNLDRYLLIAVGPRAWSEGRGLWNADNDGLNQISYLTFKPLFSHLCVFSPHEIVKITEVK